MNESYDVYQNARFCAVVEYLEAQEMKFSRSELAWEHRKMFLIVNMDDLFQIPRYGSKTRKKSVKKSTLPRPPRGKE
jgi:hypothetical protein